MIVKVGEIVYNLIYLIFMYHDDDQGFDDDDGGDDNGRYDDELMNYKLLSVKF